MWCRDCNIETNEKNCPVCGRVTEEDTPIEIMWCSECKVPIIKSVNDPAKHDCPLCSGHVSHLSADLRPVFPEERLLLELLLGKGSNEYVEKSVWAANSRYYIDGKSVVLASSVFQNADTSSLAEKLEQYAPQNSYEHFDTYIARFIEANKERLHYLKDEAFSFVRHAAEKFDEEKIVISFSGGKDSTVTADVVMKALSNPNLLHIFGDTTLEFPSTIEYAKRFRKNHPQAIFEVAKNDEQTFYNVCEDIGPPARMMRWCCSMFKTGPIARIINGLYRNQQILTFYGIRKSESVSRSKYNRIEDAAESVKIQQQTVASPIFFWKDIDIWLYLLAEDVDFNDAYRLGYDRVGCWCCPNNNQRAQFLSRIYMPERSKRWREFLIRFAEKIGKPDPEVYVDSGKWKARQGGNGLALAGDVKIRFTNCTAEEHAKIYRLVRPFNDELVGMFVPFGRVAPELGKELLKEVIVLDNSSNVPILSIQPFSQDGYEYAVKVKTMNVTDHEALQRMVAYQIRKFNVCRKCLKCESICRFGAISIVGDSYFIDPSKCVHCKMCITYIAYAEQICNWIDETYAEKEQDMRSRLQERVNDTFGKMYHGQRKVQIDKQYHVTLFAQLNGKEIVTDESEGLKRVKNFAFIAGLVDLAKEKATLGHSAIDSITWDNEAYPLVMDAPFSNADETHIKNISAVLPEVANQVIMFVMEKDWQYAEPVMAARVGKCCKLKKFSESHTEIDK